MKFFALNSQRQINVNPSKYRIDWDRKVSGPQKKVKDFLYPYWKNKLILEEFRVPGADMRFDLVNLTDRVIVEVSPNSVHRQFNPFFHKNIFNFKESVKRDFMKREWAEKNKFSFVEIYDEDMPKLSKAWFFETFDIIL